VPEIVLQRAGIAPMVEELITIAMPQAMRSIAARPVDDADPEHEAVIGTVIACVNVLSLTSRLEFVLFAPRVVFGSDYEDGRRVHSSAPSSA